MQDLVLLGGGHAHVHVLRQFGERPLKDARVTLVGRDIETPYSGMIPGFVAGHYSFEDCHIDLARLCARSGGRNADEPSRGTSCGFGSSSGLRSGMSRKPQATHPGFGIGDVWTAP